MSIRALVVANLLVASALGAQVQRPGAIAGVVKDSLGNTLPNVEVTMLKLGKSVRTDSVGEFILGALPNGTADISFRRLSYEPVILSIQIPADDTTDVEVTLGVAAQRLTGVVVQAHPDHLRQLYAFETRRKQGVGHFITRSEIEARNPMLLSDMMRMIPGVRIIPSDNGRTALHFSRVARANCPPQFYIDGIQATGFSIDDMPPGDVEGIELYAGSAGLPPEFNRLYSTSICGSIIIWTRIPGNDRKKSDP